MASTSGLHDVGRLVPELPDLSDYEDAVSSEAELEQLCQSLRSHLSHSNAARRRRMSRLDLPQQAPPVRSSKLRSSSSDNSSIEKLPSSSNGAGTFATPSKPRLRRSARQSRAANSTSDNSDPGDWRLLNHAFQEMAHYPLLVQLNQQLAIISGQLNHVEETNVLQLRIIMHLLNRIVKRKTSIFGQFFSLLRSIPLLLLAFAWPLVARAVYRWYLKIQASSNTGGRFSPISVM